MWYLFIFLDTWALLTAAIVVVRVVREERELGRQQKEAARLWDEYRSQL